MSCIPDSGGCEKRATDALVAYLNAVEGSRYEHHACLDQNPPGWWNEVFTKFAVPSAIDEIWIGSLGDDGFGGEDWIIEKVFGEKLAIGASMSDLNNLAKDQGKTKFGPLTP
jgi:hypothetical protein